MNIFLSNVILRLRVSLLSLALLLAACGGTDGGGVVSPPPTTSFTVGGTVTGLLGTGLILINDGDTLTVAQNGGFTFPSALANGAAYNAMVDSQPADPNQTCTLSKGSGTVSGANVTTINVTCTTNSFTVGGTISGLNGSGLVLQNSGSDNLAVSASGTFSFATAIASGSTYAVTVLTQPSNPAQTCTISGGTGSVSNANITSVSISCVNNPITSTGFWIPYLASAVPNTSDGKSGVFVIPSGALAASPSPNFLSTTPSTILGIAWHYTVSGSGSVTAYSPATMIYAATDSSGVAHLYGVNLGDASSVPVPVQISNLALSPSGGSSGLGEICDFQSAQTNLNDPTTLFVFLHVAGTSGCSQGNTAADNNELVHYTDSPTTPPITAAAGGFEATLNKSSQFTPLYQGGGTLRGVVLIDAANDLDFLPGNSFSNQTLLATNVQSFSVLGAPSNPSLFNAGAATEFLAITSTDESQSVYMVNIAAGTATQVYTTTGVVSHAVIDNTSLYFVDSVGVINPTAKLVALSLTTGASFVLYTFPSAAQTAYDVIGSNGAVLIFDKTVVGNPTLTTLMWISVNGGQNPTQLAAAVTGTVSASLIAAAPGDLTNDFVFVDVANVTGSTFSYSSEVLTPSGAVVQPLLANSTFLGRTTQLSGAVFQISGITDTGGGFGGGTVASVSIASSPTSTAFSTTGGGAYAIPTNYGGFLLGLSNSIGAGNLSNGALQTALAYDLSQQLIVPVSITDTNIIF